MSFIIFQIGQCGNQLGKAFYDFIIQEVIDFYYWFYLKNIKTKISSPEHQATSLDNFFFYKEKGMIFFRAKNNY